MALAVANPPLVETHASKESAAARVDDRGDLQAQLDEALLARQAQSEASSLLAVQVDTLQRQLNELLEAKVGLERDRKLTAGWDACTSPAPTVPGGLGTPQSTAKPVSRSFTSTQLEDWEKLQLRLQKAERALEHERMVAAELRRVVDSQRAAALAGQIAHNSFSQLQAELSTAREDLRQKQQEAEALSLAVVKADQAMAQLKQQLGEAVLVEKASDDELVWSHKLRDAEKAADEQCNTLAAMIDQLMQENLDLGTKLNAKSTALTQAHKELAQKQAALSALETSTGAALSGWHSSAQESYTAITIGEPGTGSARSIEPGLPGGLSDVQWQLLMLSEEVAKLHAQLAELQTEGSGGNIVGGSSLAGTAVSGVQQAVAGEPVSVNREEVAAGVNGVHALSLGNGVQQGDVGGGGSGVNGDGSVATKSAKEGAELVGASGKGEGVHNACPSLSAASGGGAALVNTQQQQQHRRVPSAAAKPIVELQLPPEELQRRVSQMAATMLELEEQVEAELEKRKHRQQHAHTQASRDALPEPLTIWPSSELNGAVLAPPNSNTSAPTLPTESATESAASGSQAPHPHAQHPLIQHSTASHSHAHSVQHPYSYHTHHQQQQQGMALTPSRSGSLWERRMSRSASMSNMLSNLSGSPVSQQQQPQQQQPQQQQYQHLLQGPGDDGVQGLPPPQGLSVELNDPRHLLDHQHPHEVHEEGLISSERGEDWDDDEEMLIGGVGHAGAGQSSKQKGGWGLWSWLTGGS